MITISTFLQAHLEGLPGKNGWKSMAAKHAYYLLALRLLKSKIKEEDVVDLLISFFLSSRQEVLEQTKQGA